MASWPRHFAAPRRASALCRSPAIGCSQPPSPAPSCTRSTPARRESLSPRSSPTRATTPSCSTNRNCSRSCADFWARPGLRADWRVSTSMLNRAPRDLITANLSRAPGAARVDHLVVAEMVAPGSRVLDVGCGDGELLRLLELRGVDGRGIELSREGVNASVAKGLAVIQGDADTDLADYPNDAFDYVILSQTLQTTRQPRVVLEHMLRIGRRAIVSFPNFGHWRIRLQVMFGGHMPHTDNLPYSWWDSPNIHFCTIKDFRQLCQVTGVKMEKAVALDAWGRALPFNA